MSIPYVSSASIKQTSHTNIVNPQHYDLLIVFTEGLYSPVNRTWSHQGVSVLIMTQITHNNKHLDYLEYIQYKPCTLYKRKTYIKHNPKVSPVGIALATQKKRQMKLGDAGTITMKCRPI